jgi:hypothetical protein
LLQLRDLGQFCDLALPFTDVRNNLCNLTQSKDQREDGGNAANPLQRSFECNAPYLHSIKSIIPSSFAYCTKKIDFGNSQSWIASKEGLETYSRGYGAATLRTDVDESFLERGTAPHAGVKYFDDTEWS